MYAFNTKWMVFCLLVGACAAANECKTGLTYCPSSSGQMVCTNTMTDSRNCNGCGNVCKGSTRCINGQCGCISSPQYPRSLCTYSSPTYSFSMSVCQDLRTARNACGRCDVICPANMYCYSGTCACPRNSIYPNPTACTDGATTYCVDTNSHSQHCGGCFNECYGNHVSGGRCVCPRGKTECPYGPDKNGVLRSICVDTSTDDMHCGDCWQTCGLHASATCKSGKCISNCPDFAPKLCEVDGAPYKSRCVDTTIHNENCGDCFNICPSWLECIGGQCTCRPGYKECTIGPNHSKMCVDTQTSNEACGNCPDSGGEVCTAGMTCQSGVCQCPPGEAMCFPGRCFNFNTSINACGSCNNQCKYLERCVNQRCKY